MATETELIVRIAAQDTATRQVKQLQSSIIRLVGAVASLTATFKALSFPIQQAVDFERALRDVQKTTDFADSSIVALGDSLRALSVQTGVAAVDLADIAARAGQLGLGRQGQQAILEFTDTIARFAVVADLSVDQAATSIAKIANIFQIPIDQSERVAAAFNELSNTTTATAEQLIDVVRRVGDASGLLDFADSLGLAAQALELGQTPEVAGTAIIKTFSNAQTKAKEFADVLNITTDEWARALQTDGVRAIQDVARAISQLSQLEQGALIKDLFGGGRQFAFGAKLVADAANDFKILTRTLSDAEQSFIDATSAQREYERISNSTARQTEILQARFGNLAITFGEVLNPAVREIVESLQNFLADEAVQGRVLVFAEAVRDAVTALADWIATLADADGSFTTFFNVVKAFIGLGLANIFVALIGRVVSFGARMALLTRVIGQATASFGAFRTILGQFAAGFTAAEIASGKAAAAIAANATVARATSGIVGPIQARLNQQLERRNQIEREYRLLRIQAIRDARAQAAAAGQSFAAQVRRGQAVRNAIGGLGDRGGTAQRRNVQTELDNINHRYRVLNANIGTTTRNLAAASTGFGRFLAVIGRVGLAIGRFVTGPIGLLISIFVGGPLIAAVDKFFSGFNDEVEESAARTKAALAEQQKAISAAIGAFREGLQNRTEPVSLNFTGNVEDFTNRVTRGAAALKSLTQQIAGARAEDDRLLATRVNILGAIERTNDALEQQAREQDRVNATYAPGARQEALQSIQGEITRLEAERDGYLQALDATNANILAVQQQSGDLQGRRARQIAALAANVSDVDVAAIQILRNLSQTESRIASLTGEIAKMDTAIQKAQNDGEDALPIQVAAANAKAELRDLQGQAEALTKTYEASGSRIKTTLTDVVNVLTEVKDGVFTISDAEFGNIAIDLVTGNVAANDTFKEMLDLLGQNIREVAAFERQAKVFDIVTKRIEETKDAMQGVFDNLRVGAQATRDRVAEIGRQLDGLPTKRNIDIQIRQINDAGIEGFAERQANRLKAELERQLDIARTAEGQAARIAQGRAKELQTRIDALNVEKENNAVLREKRELEISFNRALEEAVRLQKEAGVLEAQVKAASKGNTPEEIRNRELLNQKVLRTNNALQEQQREVEKAAEAFQKFDGVVALDIFNPDAFGGLTSALTDADVTKVTQQLKDNTEGTLAAQASLITEAKDLADKNLDAAKSANLYSQAIAYGNEQIKELSDRLGLTDAQLQSARTAAEGLAKNLESSVTAAEALKSVQTGAIDVIPLELPSIDEVRTAATGIADGVAEQVQIALRNSVIEGTKRGTEELPAQPIDFDPAYIAREIQDGINSNGPYQIDLEGNLQASTGGNSGFAGGGMVFGPGTSTSDSILARLSRGEFVMDAFTTRIFGPDFFRSLQRAARTGNPFRIPGFAAGGLVGETSGISKELTSFVEMLSREPQRDIVDLNVSIGGETARLQGDREEVARFQRALKNISRGRAR